MATVQDIHEAANVLVAQGKKATLAAVRSALGGGSFTTISEALKSWPGRAQHSPAQETAPDTLAEVASTAVAEIWKAALQAAEDRLVTERMELEKNRQEIEAERAEAMALADRMAEELAIEQARVRSLTVDFAHLRDLLDQERAMSAQLKAEGAQAKAVLAEVQRRANDLARELNHERKARTEAETRAAKHTEEAAELRGKLAALTADETKRPKKR